MLTCLAAAAVLCSMFSLNVILVTLGSSGDVHPFVGIGRAMRDRGHRVTLITNPLFQELVERSGLQFSPLGTVAQFNAMLTNPDLWHRTRAFRTVFDEVIANLRPMYEAVLRHVTPGDTVIAASSLAFGARLVQDKFDVPTATVHLAPGLFRSVIEPPNLPGLWMPKWLSPKTKQNIFDVGDKWVIDRRLGPRLNAFRAELGLPPVSKILDTWWNSPTRVIGLFPEWYGRPQPDWPKQTRCTGFAMFDERDLADLPAELEQFLDEGESPIVFTPGSAMFHGERFFAEAARACLQLGRRGILLSRHATHIPRNLPPTVAYVDYAPFSALLPRAAALVHHGGIGTSAQAMAAGVRQVVTPFAHDQLDNADRLRKLDVSRTLPQRKFNAKSLARVLGDWLNDRAAADACAAVKEKFQQSPDGLSKTCECLEALWNDSTSAED